MELVARHYADGKWVRLLLNGARIARVEEADGPTGFGPEDDWIGPAFWDIQLNGRWGISFSAEDLTVEGVVAVVRAQAGLGAARICPTLMTAHDAGMTRGVRMIAEACERYPDVAARIVGLHLEGPYISHLDGYRGAHLLDAVRDPDWDEFASWQEASGGRIRIMTLAPERPGALEFIRRATGAGVAIALGHTAADPETITQAAEAGARLSTHLGNGIVAALPRHPNPIWTQAANDRLNASLIADGHHLSSDVLRVLVRAKTPERVILVSDASPLAGLAVGAYGDWAVDPTGKVVVAGTPYLAGSNQGLEVGLNTLMGATDISLVDAFAMVTRNPARLLGQPEPMLEAGQPANLVRFRHDGRRFALLATCVDGQWAAPEAADPTPDILALSPVAKQVG